MKKFKKGFTITELVIVIAVIAVLAAVLIPTFVTVFSKANESVALQETDAVMKDYLAYNNGKIEEGTIFVHGTDDDQFVFIFEDGLLEAVEAEVSVDGDSVSIVFGSETTAVDYKEVDYSSEIVKIYEKIVTEANG